MIYRQIGSESLAVGAAAVGFASIPTRLTTGMPYYAFCTVETASIRVNSYDTPTAGGAEGSPLMAAGETFEVWGGDDMVRFKAIAATGVAAVLQVLYFGEAV